jgi:hypothetical protein
MPCAWFRQVSRQDQREGVESPSTGSALIRRRRAYRAGRRPSGHGLSVAGRPGRAACAGLPAMRFAAFCARLATSTRTSRSSTDHPRPACRRAAGPDLHRLIQLLVSISLPLALLAPKGDRTCGCAMTRHANISCPQPTIKATLAGGLPCKAGAVHRCCTDGWDAVGSGCFFLSDLASCRTKPTLPAVTNSVAEAMRDELTLLANYSVGAESSEFP